MKKLLETPKGRASKTKWSGRVLCAALSLVGIVPDPGYAQLAHEITGAYIASNPWAVNSNGSANAIASSTNRLMGATTGRYTVTATGFPVNAVPFDGLYETPVTISAGVTGIYEIDFNPQLNWTANTASGYTFNNGFLVISFFNVNYASTVTVEFYRTVGGVDQWATEFSTTTNNHNPLVITTSPKNFGKKIRVTLRSPTNPVSLTEMEWFSTREEKLNQYTMLSAFNPWGLDIGGPGFQFRNPAWSVVSAIKNTGDAFFGVGGGNIGIGTATPSTKLHVVGDITVTGNIAAKYQDLAEWVPASRPFLPGTVLVLDTEQTNHVQASSRAYDTRVAGVVSDMPGLLLGEEGAGKVKAATTGRVKARVDATKRPIHIGDLLVTSEKSGMAMASEPISVNGHQFHQPGTILGKALESIPEGEGEILVLLTLQ